jgi:hypothetical protein
MFWPLTEAMGLRKWDGMTRRDMRTAMASIAPASLQYNPEVLFGQCDSAGALALLWCKSLKPSEWRITAA